MNILSVSWTDFNIQFRIKFKLSEKYKLFREKNGLIKKYIIIYTNVD